MKTRVISGVVLAIILAAVLIPGGYVLAAIVAFFAGVIITVVIYKYRSWSEKKEKTEDRV